MPQIVTSTMVEKLANWAANIHYEDLSQEAVTALKGRLLDSIGCAIGAIHEQPPASIHHMIDNIGGKPITTLIGGGKSSPSDTAFYNGTLIRYLDFNDSYLAKNETCHPSDNIAPVLAAAEYSNISGKDFLTALAVAYQVQCRLSDIAPVRDHGFDHTVQGAYAAATGAAHAIRLDKTKMANAIAIAGTSLNSLRVTRTGELSNWKGLAYPNTAMGAIQATMLALYGITGPREVFEGNKGLMDTITGPFYIDWSKEDVERVTKTITKRYNAEIHSQASIEGLIELKNEIHINPRDIKQIKLETFDVAFNIIGGGEEGGKKLIRYKEEADHSLPYMLAAAYLDNEVMPEQYTDERIKRNDVQQLLQKVHISPKQSYSDRFPQEMACRITLETVQGETYTIEKNNYHGFHTRPANWATLMEKYNGLTQHVDKTITAKIADMIANMEHLSITEFTNTLRQIK